MKAILKIDYPGLKKGSVYNFVIVNEKIVCCLANGADFGWSEILPTEDELFELGRYLLTCYCPKNEQQEGFLRASEMDKAAQSVVHGLPLTIKKKALNTFIYN